MSTSSTTDSESYGDANSLVGFTDHETSFGSKPLGVTSDDTSEMTDTSDYETVPSTMPMIRKPRKLLNTSQLLKRAMPRTESPFDVLPDNITPEQVLAQYYLGDPNEAAGEIQIRFEEKPLSEDEESLSEGEMQFRKFVNQQMKEDLKPKIHHSSSNSKETTFSGEFRSVRLVPSRFKPTSGWQPRRNSLVGPHNKLENSSISSISEELLEENQDSSPNLVSSFTRDLMELRKMRQRHRTFEEEMKLKKKIRNINEKLLVESLAQSPSSDSSSLTKVSKKRTVRKLTVWPRVTASLHANFYQFQGFKQNQQLCNSLAISEQTNTFPPFSGWQLKLKEAAYVWPGIKATALESKVGSESTLSADECSSSEQPNGKPLVVISEGRVSKVTHYLRSLQLSISND